MKINIGSDNRYVLVLFILMVFINILVFANAADVDTSQDWHPVQQIAKSAAECYAIDEDGDGIIDRADALLDGPDPDPVQYVDTSSPWHPLQQISTGPSSSTSIDDDENGWPDICESLAEPGTTTAAGAVFHPIFQISRSSSNMQSIDSEGSGWPDKCDCVLSELDTDVNNCGSCGTVCSGTTPECCSGECKDLDSDVNNCGECGTVCSSQEACIGGTCISTVVVVLNEQTGDSCNTLCSNIGRPCQSVGTDADGTNNRVWKETCSIGCTCHEDSANCDTLIIKPNPPIGAGEDSGPCAGHGTRWTNCRCPY